MDNTQGHNGAALTDIGNMSSAPETINAPAGTMNDNEVEELIQAKGLTAPRLTPDYIKSVVASEDYVNLDGTTTTICYLTLQNGFTVTGESACVDPANFNQEVGCQVAYNNAISKVWNLEGYLLKQRLHEAAGQMERIARVAHEVNRAYCTALGDNSQPAWEDAPAWQRESARMGVDLHTMGDFGPEASHIGWMNQKLSEGWVYGPVKDPEAKTHPCIRPFDELPREQQAKDYLFRAVVHALK